MAERKAFQGDSIRKRGSCNLFFLVLDNGSGPGPGRRKTRLVFRNLVITRNQPLNQGGTESPVFHLVKTGDSTTLRGGHLVNFLLRVGPAFEQQFRGPFYCLGGNQVGCSRIK